MIKVNGKRYRINKRVWRKRLIKLCTASIMLGFLWLLGSVGAMEVENISMKQGMIQSIIGLVVMGLSVFGLNVLDYSEYNELEEEFIEEEENRRIQ